MPKLTIEQAIRIGKKLDVNFDAVSPKTLLDGMLVELEHGKKNSRTNVSNDSIELTAKIALAHLDEYPDYYARLERMEKQAETYWLKRQKPRIFL